MFNIVMNKTYNRVQMQQFSGLPWLKITVSKMCDFLIAFGILSKLHITLAKVSSEKL
jgi:hypothetical protein